MRVWIMILVLAVSGCNKSVTDPNENDGPIQCDDSQSNEREYFKPAPVCEG